jgi:hypothetical protein
MKSALFLSLAVLAALPAFGQYSATTLTRKVAPRPQPARAPVGGTGGIVAQRPATPVDPAKVQAQKKKTESDLVKYHRQRAEAGSDNAQYELGVRYLIGNGLDKDEKLGREWLAKSAKSGNAKAVKKLAELGPPKDEPKETKVEKAVTLGK